MRRPTFFMYGTVSGLTRFRVHGAQEEVQRIGNGFIHAHFRFPAQQTTGIFDARRAVFHVLIAFAVISAALDQIETGKRRELYAQRMRFKARQQYFRQFTNALFVGRVTDVDYLAITQVVAVFNDAEQRFDTVVDVSEATLLFAAVHQFDRRPFNQIEDQLRDSAGTADTRGVEVIQTRPQD